MNTHADLEIRELCSVSELKDAEVLQTEVWGEGDKPDNADLMLAIQHEGGLVAGAFVDGRMLGFLFAFPSSETGIQHSHRLAVHPDSQGMGLGGKLKWYQRDWCLDHDVHMVRWTFDPLRHVNANLNISKLGATCGVYHEDYYGQMEGINAGVPSDRLVAEWHLNSESVNSAKNKIKTPSSLQAMRIEIPRDFEALIGKSIDEALSERLRVRELLKSAFANGHRITDFDKDKSEYILTKS